MLYRLFSVCVCVCVCVCSFVWVCACVYEDGVLKLLLLLLVLVLLLLLVLPFLWDLIYADCKDSRPCPRSGLMLTWCLDPGRPLGGTWIWALFSCLLIYLVSSFFFSLLLETVVARPVLRLFGSFGVAQGRQRVGLIGRVIIQSIGYIWRFFFSPLFLPNGFFFGSWLFVCRTWAEYCTEPRRARFFIFFVSLISLRFFYDVFFVAFLFDVVRYGKKSVVNEMEKKRLPRLFSPTAIRLGWWPIDLHTRLSCCCCCFGCVIF